MFTKLNLKDIAVALNLSSADGVEELTHAENSSLAAFISSKYGLDLNHALLGLTSLPAILPEALMEFLEEPGVAVEAAVETFLGEAEQKVEAVVETAVETLVEAVEEGVQDVVDAVENFLSDEKAGE